MKLMVKNLKIRNKLILIILSITLIALTIGFSSILFYYKTTLQTSHLNQARITAEITGNGMVSILIFGEATEGQQSLDKFVRVIPTIQNVFVYNEKDTLFASFNHPSHPPVQAPPIPEKPLLEFRSDYIHIFQPIIFQKKKWGSIYLHISTRQLDQDMRNLILVMLLIIAALLPLSFFLAAKLQGIISKPILNLGNVAKKVSEEANYTLRAEKTVNDEIGMLYDGFNDMMEQIQNRDIQRDEVESHLLAAEFFLSSVMQSMPSMVVTIERNGAVTQWNKAAEAMTGITPADAMDKTIWLLIPDFQKYKDALQKIYQTKETMQFYKELVKISDHTLYLNVTIFPLENAQSPRFVLMVNNVTETELKEQQLRQSQKMETVGTLAGGLAHDFNNVLGGIIGTISLYKYKISKNKKITHAEIDKYFTTVEDSANRASDMVQHLLSLTRKQELTFAPTDLNKLLRSTVKICKNTFDKSIEIKARYAKEPAVTNVDPTQIEQSLLNLCINASHAMTLMRNDGERYGGTLNIAIEKIKADKFTFKMHPEFAETEDLYWRVSVEDTGVGMNQKITTKIFDPFFTTKGEGKGTGLGLAMVYNIMKQHKGFIDVYSQEDLGTTFHIYLPLYKADTGEIPIQAQEEINMGEGFILVVDDEEIMRQTARSILEECGYSILLAANGYEAVEVYKKNSAKIKAVVLDMVMPKMSGKQCYIELSQINKDVKVILASGFKQDTRVESILDLGVKEFIQKPYSLVKLANSLHRIIKEDQ